MTLIQKSAEVPYTPEQMFELVNHIEAYPSFLPGCRSSTVLSRTEDEVRATLHLAKGGISHSFTTLNRLQPGKMIELRLLEGPFRRLQGYWRFEPIDPKGCRIYFDVEFVFANRLLDAALGPLLQGIASTFVDAFCQRAAVVYGLDNVRLS